MQSRLDVLQCAFRSSAHRVDPSRMKVRRRTIGSCPAIEPGRTGAPRPGVLSAAMRLTRAITVLAALSAVAAAGCGREPSTTTTARPTIGVKGDEQSAARDLGFPVLATKNTTRIGGADSVANAAAAARAVYTGATRVTRPSAVVLADRRDWRVGLAASVLMGQPLRAPLLYTDGDALPAGTKDALAALKPTGAREIAGAQVIRVGTAAKVDGKTTDIRGGDPIALARSIDAFASAARKTTSDRVLIVSADDAAYAMPAAAWAAKAGDPILFAHRDAVPRETRAAIAAHQQPKIYVLGPTSVISDKALDQLRRLGTVTRIAAKGEPDPVSNAVAFARFLDGSFGWGIVDPGHGLVFASDRTPTDAAAAAPLSASGTYGPLLLVDSPDTLPKALRGFLLDIQPGYTRDPVRGVYNHGWIVGDERTMSIATQSTLDALLEIVPVNERAAGAATP